MDRQDVEDLAELKVRQYFDCFEQKALPNLVAAAIAAHNDSRESHGRVEAKVNKLIWIIVGAAATGGLTGGGLVSLLTAL